MLRVLIHSCNGQKYIVVTDRSTADFLKYIPSQSLPVPVRSEPGEQYIS